MSTQYALVKTIMLDKIKKYSILGLVVLVMAMGVYFYIQKRSYQNTIVNLHNEIALSSETVEVQKGLYKKATAQIDNLEDSLKAIEALHESDEVVVKALRKEIKDRDEKILAVNRLAAKWKSAYEAEANAHQEDLPPPDHDDTTVPPAPGRTKITFDKDFGYIGVSGYTLSNPAYAWVKVEQNRPLYLTLAITQSKDKRWSTYVTSSEENVEVDISVSAVNPYILDRRWYEDISVDFGVDFYDSIIASAGASYPIGPIYLSAGVWGNDADVGPYVSLGYSWNPFARN